MQTFMRSLLSKITWSANVPAYDYALFDCPPSFTMLSYSVLSVCDLILIPINPDFYAAKDVPSFSTCCKCRSNHSGAENRRLHEQGETCTAGL